MNGIINIIFFVLLKIEKYIFSNSKKYWDESSFNSALLEISFWDFSLGILSESEWNIFFINFGTYH